MKKFQKMKHLAIGIILGILLSSVFPVSAMVKQYYLQEVAYKVDIDGVPYVDSTNPILNYEGVTYVPMRSILEASGLSLKWNTYTKVAEITHKLNSEVEKGASTMETRQGEVIIEGVSYITPVAIHEAIKEGPYNIVYRSTLKAIWIFRVETDENILEVPFIVINGSNYVEYSFFETEILPMV